MRSLKNYIVYIVLFVLSTIFCLPWYVFAQSSSNSNKCSACNATPAAMQAFINFEVELLESLQEVSETKQTLLTNPNYGLFAWWMPLLWSFLKSTYKKKKKNLDSEFKATRAVNITTVLLTEMLFENGDSAISSITILFKDRAFVRDYKILQELDMSANDVIWDMWMLGIWDDRASAQVQEKILWLQSKYSKIYW